MSCQLARVGVRVILVDVVCVMLVLIAHVVVRAVNTQFSKPFSVVGDVLFTKRVWKRLHEARDGLFLKQRQNESGYTLIPLSGKWRRRRRRYSPSRSCACCVA